MANYIASVALKLHDQFSGPALKAKAAWADLENAGDKFQYVGAKAVDAGKKATFGLTVPLFGVGAAAVKAGVDFNEGLANVASLDVAEGRVRELGKDVQNMAVQYGQSTASLNEGLYNVISAFGDTADTSKNLEINTKSAAAGMATTTDSIALTSAVTKGYGDTSAAAMQKVADLAFQTVKLGQTTFPELASSIGKVTGSANALGVSQEDLFAVFATTTGVVGTAAEVSTSTAAILNEMIKPGKALSSAIASLGYSSSDAMVQELGFGGAVQALGGYAQDSNQKITNLFSSTEAGKVAMAIAGSQASVYNDKLKEMHSSSGALNAAFAAQTEGINEQGFQFAQLKSQVAVSAQYIGQSLMPALGSLLDIAVPVAVAIGNVATWFSGLPEPVQNTTLALLGVAAGIGPVTMIAGSVIKLTGVLMTAIPAAWGFATAHWAALGPLLIIVGAIAAVVAVGVLLYKNWDTIKAFGAKVWDGFIGGIQAVWGWVSRLLDNPLIATAGLIFAPFITIPALIIKHWGAVKTFFADLFGGISKGWNKISGWFTGLFGDGGKNATTVPSAGNYSLYSKGGYTGSGSVNQMAGIVHAGEYVFSQDAVSRIGLGNLERLHRGRGQNSSGPSGGGNGNTNGSTYITIENVNLHADDVQDLMDFVRMLKLAGNAA